MYLEAVVVIILGILAWLYFRDEEHPIDRLPGPPKLPIIGNVHQLMQMHPEKILEITNEYSKAYGDRYPFKIIKKRVLNICRPSDVEVVLSHSKNITKSIAYDFLRNWLGAGLLVSTGPHWHRRRKILTPAFHFNILKNFATVMEEKVNEFVKLLREKNGADVDIIPLVSDFTLFTICETAMGTKLDNDKSAATLEYKDAILHIGLVVIKRLTKIWMWTDFIFRITSTGKKFYKLLATVLAFADNVIIDRKARGMEKNIGEVLVDEELGTKRRLAMLDLLLEAEAKGEIDTEGIRDEVNTFMFAGHDTTALAITFGLMLLADHEDIQENILMEIQSILSSTDRSPSMSDLADMKYMEAVIKEILRLYPSVPLIGRITDEDFTLDDILIKKGTTVHICIYELHHREDLFPDAEAFKPERFLPGSQLKHPFSYVPFSAGPRNCIGQRFAMQEMKTTLCEIIRNFKLVPKVKGARPRLISDLVLRPIDPIYVKFIPRN